MDAPSDPDPVERLLQECLESEEPDPSAALERACAEHPDLAAALRERWGRLADVGLVPAGGAREFPERLGEFRLVERLGGGGMGVVYRAEQPALGRQVALKLVRPELLYFGSARERFRRETEAVARLQHPGIVPIHTVGETDGLPWFAMELVPGATLAEALRALRGRAPESLAGADLAAVVAPDAAPTPAFGDTWVRTALRLVAAVADALEHAHARGVLHRDVKPSNVVLTPAGVPRLIDFGLASSSGGERVTRTGSAPGSLAYMSPEQLRGDRELDARTDVYSLGVTLYELLTLRLPFAEESEAATRDAVLAGRPPAIRDRNRLVSRDVETVCLKALDPDPARRYASAAAFASDLRAALELRPVAARRPGPLLRARRWTQRHPGATAALALAAVVLVGIPSALAVQSRRHARSLQGLLTSEREAHEAAAAERDRAGLEARDASAVSDFLVELFGASDPYETGGREVTAADLLARGAARLETELADQPVVRARLLERLGLSYAHIGHYAEAAPLLERAVALHRERAGPRATETARALVKLGELRRLAGHTGAVETLEEAVAILAERLGGGAEETVRARVELASALTVAGRLDESGPLLRALLELSVETDGDPRQLRAMLLVNLADVAFRSRDWSGCHAAATESLALRRELHAEPDPELVSSLNLVALSAKYLERFDEAADAYDEMLEATRALYGDDSHHVALALQNRAALEFRRGDLAAAERLLGESWAIYRETVDLAHPHALGCLLSLAELPFRRREYAAARDLYLEAVPRARAGVNPGSRAEMKTLQSLALCHWALGEFDEAERWLRAAVEAAERAGADDARRAVLGVPLASVLRHRPGGAVEAEALYRSAEPAVAASGPPTVLAEIRFGLGELADADGRPDDAARLWEAAAGAPAGDGPEGWAVAAAEAALGAREGGTAEGRARWDRACRDLAGRLGADHFEVRAARARLAAGAPR